jgi:competence protein ComQ
MNLLAETVGIVLQIQNDVRDIVRWDLKNDLLQKKRTLPVLFLLAETETGGGFRTFRQWYDGQLTRDEFLQQKQACMEYIRESGCIEYAKIIQSMFIDRADELLQALPADPEWKGKFKAITLDPFR